LKYTPCIEVSVSASREILLTKIDDLAKASELFKVQVITSKVGTCEIGDKESSADRVQNDPEM
jgi:hypothetical protein